jgi:hypothetical protein
MDEQINYPWHEAPAWAKWAAVNQNGRMFWYRIKPIKVKDQWAVMCAKWPAVDQNGRVFCYRIKPTKVKDQWAVMTTDFEICYLELGFLNNPPEDFDWKRSLQKRPE